MKCPFCGHEIEEGRQMCCGCPMAGQCKAICCPNCGYELERESKLADLAKKLFGKRKNGVDRAEGKDSPGG